MQLRKQGPIWGLTSGVSRAWQQLRLFSQGSPAASASDDAHTPLPALPLGLATYTIWGANTGVGKTLASAGIAHAACKLKVLLFDYYMHTLCTRTETWPCCACM